MAFSKGKIMIIAIYNDDYNNDFVATGENLDEVMQQLETDTGDSNIPLSSVMVFEGTPVKVTKTVTYTVQKT
jgi:hypothetical protein